MARARERRPNAAHRGSRIGGWPLAAMACADQTECEQASAEARHGWSALSVSQRKCVRLHRRRQVVDVTREISRALR
jgi:hypothetical protein